MSKIGKCAPKVLAAIVGLGGALKKENTIERARCLKQRKAALEYIGTNMPGACCSDVVRTKDGWFCMVKYLDEYIGLYFTKTENGEYSFTKKKI